MFKWLRYWLAWRFSLTRLVVAVVFLGAFVGLNMREIGPWMPWYYGQSTPTGRTPYGNQFYFLTIYRHWGWPLPFIELETPPPDDYFQHKETKPDNAELVAHDARRHAATFYQLPWTHQTYRILDLKYFPSSGLLLNCVVLDAIILFVPLALILFLQVPRRKVVAKVEKT